MVCVNQTQLAVAERLESLIGQQVEVKTALLAGFSLRGELQRSAGDEFHVGLFDVTSMDSAHVFFGSGQVTDITDGDVTILMLAQDET